MMLKINKQLQNMAGRLAVNVMHDLSKRLTPKGIERIARVLAIIAYTFSRRYRGVALRNMTRALGNEYSSGKIQTMVREVFLHFCRVSLEFFYFGSASRDNIDKMIDIVNINYLEEALNLGKGVVLITAHFGNWELLARKLCILGYPVTVIARDSDDASTTGVVNRIRENAGYKVLGRDKSVRGALECLKRNEILGILPDQNLSTGGVMVEFFGQKACTATGPAVFALRTGAAVVPVFTPRNRFGMYEAVFQPALEVTSTGDKDADEYALTVAIQNAIEQTVREYPTQWLWLHDRWKRARELEAEKHA